MGGGREAGVEQDGVVSGGGEGAPRLVRNVKGGERRCVRQREGTGVLVDAVGERARAGIRGLRARFGRGAGEEDAGLAFGMCIDAGKGRVGHGRVCSSERATE